MFGGRACGTACVRRRRRKQAPSSCAGPAAAARAALPPHCLALGQCTTRSFRPLRARTSPSKKFSLLFLARSSCSSSAHMLPYWRRLQTPTVAFPRSHYFVIVTIITVVGADYVSSNIFIIESSISYHPFTCHHLRASIFSRIKCFPIHFHPYGFYSFHPP